MQKGASTFLEIATRYAAFRGAIRLGTFLRFW